VGQIKQTPNIAEEPFIRVQEDVAGDEMCTILLSNPYKKKANKSTV